MICKECNHEMVEGFIPTRGISWLPKEERIDKIYFREKKPKEEEGFMLGGWRMLTMKAQPAWYCPRCELIVIDCKIIVN